MFRGWGVSVVVFLVFLVLLRELPEIGSGLVFLVLLPELPEIRIGLVFSVLLQELLEIHSSLVVLTHAKLIRLMKF